MPRSCGVSGTSFACLIVCLLVGWLLALLGARIAHLSPRTLFLQLLPIQLGLEALHSRLSGIARELSEMHFATCTLLLISTYLFSLQIGP